MNNLSLKKSSSGWMYLQSWPLSLISKYHCYVWSYFAICHLQRNKRILLSSWSNLETGILSRHQLKESCSLKATARRLHSSDWAILSYSTVSFSAVSAIFPLASYLVTHPVQIQLIFIISANTSIYQINCQANCYGFWKRYFIKVLCFHVHHVNAVKITFDTVCRR